MGSLTPCARALGRGNRRSLLAVLLASLLLVASGTPASADDVSNLINELMCPADCVEPLAVCQMPQAATMRAFVREKLSSGWSRQEVIDDLVAQYGERVLAAPTKEGFNLSAWVMPFAAIAVGGLLVTLLVVSWARRKSLSDSRVEARVRQLDEAGVEGYRSRLAAELKDFE